MLRDGVSDHYTPQCGAGNVDFCREGTSNSCLQAWLSGSVSIFSAYMQVGKDLPIVVHTHSTDSIAVLMASYVGCMSRAYAQYSPRVCIHWDDTGLVK